MKKLKKSSNKKPVVVFIYGPIAAGKLTISENLSKKTGFKVFHNHILIDLVKELISDDQTKRQILRHDMHFNAVKSLMNLKVSTIFTHAFSSNYVFPSGMTDPEFVKKTESAVIKNGGIFYGVQLMCDGEVLLQRLVKDSRNKHGKLRDVKIMKELLIKYDHITSAPIKNNFIIDNTKLSPKKVVEMIIKHFKLK